MTAASAVQRGGEARRVASFLLAALGLPAAGALLLPLARPHDASLPVAGALLLCLALSGLVLARGGARGARLAVGLAALLAVPAWGEVGLRWAGARPGGARIEFGYPRPEEIVHLERDPELFWRLPTSLPGVNSSGFMGPELAPAPPGARRLVFLGDSCTEQGYPARVAERLNRAAGRSSSFFLPANLATSGYSSWQGRVLAERWLPVLEPELVGVCYGWNDHWLAWGATDAEKASARSSPLARLASRLRVLEALLALRSGEAEPLDVPRVPPARYRENLVAIGGLAEGVGARVLLITAASAHPRRGVPDYLVARRFARTAEDVLRRHREYNDVVRALAAERGWGLLDLAREVEADPALDALFQEDGIHWTDAGLDWVAERVADAARALGLVPGGGADE